LLWFTFVYTRTALFPLLAEHFVSKLVPSPQRRRNAVIFGMMRSAEASWKYLSCY
jgi:hypothetical protein